MSTTNADLTIATRMQSSPRDTSISSSTPSLWTHLPALTSWWFQRFQTMDRPRTGHHLNQWKSQPTCEDQSLPSAKAVGPVPGDSHQASDGHLWSVPIFWAKWLQSGSPVWMCHSARLVDEKETTANYSKMVSATNCGEVLPMFSMFLLQVQPGSMNHSFRIHLEPHRCFHTFPSLCRPRLARTLWPRHGRIAAEPGSGQQVRQNNGDIVFPTCGNSGQSHYKCFSSFWSYYCTSATKEKHKPPQKQQNKKHRPAGHAEPPEPVERARSVDLGSAWCWAGTLSRRAPVFSPKVLPGESGVWSQQMEMEVWEQECAMNRSSSFAMTS